MIFILLILYSLKIEQNRKTLKIISQIISLTNKSVEFLVNLLCNSHVVVLCSSSSSYVVL